MLVATPSSQARAESERCTFVITLPSELVREVVFERELQLQPVAVEVVQEVLASSPLELRANHDVRDRVVEQVAEHVLARLERVWRLTIRVVDIHPRVTERAAELLAPRVIEEDHAARDGQRLADEGRHGARVAFGTDIGRRVVHVVLDALTDDELEPEDVLAGLEVGAEI